MNGNLKQYFAFLAMGSLWLLFGILLMNDENYQSSLLLACIGAVVLMFAVISVLRDLKKGGQINET